MNNSLMKQGNGQGGKPQGRKLFPNKAVNIALIISGSLIVLALVAASLYVYVF